MFLKTFNGEGKIKQIAFGEPRIWVSSTAIMLDLYGENKNYRVGLSKVELLEALEKAKAMP